MYEWLVAISKDNGHVVKKNDNEKSDKTKNNEFSFVGTLAKNAVYSSGVTLLTYPLHAARIRILDPEQSRNPCSNLREYYKGCKVPFFKQYGFVETVKNSYSGLPARLVHTPSAQAIKLGLSIASDRAIGDSEDSIVKGAEKSAFIMAGAALLCPIESVGIAAATDPKNGSRRVIDGYKKSLSKGNIHGIYVPSRVISATGRSGAGIVSFTMGGDYINSNFRDEDGKIKGNDLYKASILTGVVTAIGCTPLELIHFWGKNAQNQYSVKTLTTNIGRAMKGSGSGIGPAMIPRLAITVPLAAARNMGRLASPLEHNVHNYDNKVEAKEPEKPWKQKVLDPKNGNAISPMNFLFSFSKRANKNVLESKEDIQKSEGVGWAAKIERNTKSRDR